MADLPVIPGQYPDFKSDGVPAPGVLASHFTKAEGRSSKVEAQLTHLKLKPSKCHFFQKQVAFLGHIISEQGINIDPDKVQKIAECPGPRMSIKQKVS